MSTLLRVTSVLVLAASMAACSGDGSKDTSDAGSDGGANNGSSDGGDSGGDNEGQNTANNGDPDGGDNTPGSNGDGGTNGVDGGTNTGNAFACPNAATTVGAAGGQVTSDDGFLTLSLSAGALAQNADIKVCAVPQDKRPAQVVADGAGPVSAVYQIEPLALTFAADVSANLTIQGAPLTAITSADGVAPLTFHRLPNTGAIARLNDVTMRLVAEPVLRGELDGGGHIYARHVDSAGARYAVQVGTSAGALTKLTGETFDLGAKVTVVGTPNTLTRTLGLVTRGCDLEPLQLSGVEQAKVQEGACEVEPVLRTGTALTAAGDVLTTGAVIDLTTGGSDVDATRLPPRFFCTYPGAAKAGVHLQFGVGAEREVTVTAEQDVTCTPSGDRLGALERRRANRIQHGPVVTTTAPLGTPEHIPFVRVTTAASLAGFTALGSDGWLATAPIALPSENLFNSFKFTSTAVGGAAVNGLTMLFAPSDATEPNSYVAGTYDNASYRFYEDAGGRLTAEGPNNAELSVDVAGFREIDLQFGALANADTQISFADGTIDALVISGRDADGKVRFERWIRPSDLSLTAGRRSTPLLTTVQKTQVGAISGLPAFYEIALLNLSWDEDRGFWPNGRVLPLAGGHLVRLQASRINPEFAPTAPCPSSVTTLQNGCQVGPYETLLVATDEAIEMFDPVTGSHLGAAFEASATGPDKFRHVVSGPDGCLYASQQSATPGVYRYRPTSAGVVAIDGAAPYFGTANAPGLSTGLAPLGLVFRGDDLVMANSVGGLLSYDGVTFDEVTNDSLRPHGLLVVPGDFLLASSQEQGSGSQTVQVFLPSPGGTDEYLGSLSGPEQICLDAADSPNILLVERDDARVNLYNRTSRDLITDFEYSGAESPQGAWALLNDGQWLVSGTDGLGVDVVMPGSAVKSATDTAFDDDGYYISAVCLPFDPGK